MSETETNRSSKGKVIRQPEEIVDDSDAETAHRDDEIVETARRWGQAVTAADHQAIYESSARDIAGWLERQGHQEAN